MSRTEVACSPLSIPCTVRKQKEQLTNEDPDGKIIAIGELKQTGDPMGAGSEGRARTSTGTGSCNLAPGSSLPACGKEEREACHV
ncbi:hypothetical protein EHM76_06120 [bacterium]|nr:MAG: hypothetical protein EHM76_06120 [bacterium]